MGRPLLLPLLPLLLPLLLLLLPPAFLQPGEYPGPPRYGLCPNHRRGQPKTEAEHLGQGPGSHLQQTRAGPIGVGAAISSPSTLPHA